MTKSAIFTVASGDYRAFVPMFKYCAERACPNSTVIVHEAEYWPNEAAAMRFLLNESEPEYDKALSDYDQVLIEDVDVMMTDRNALDERFDHLIDNRLLCYSNICNDPGNCPGVHFVTSAWWEHTKKAREEELENLFHMTTLGSDVPKGYDERMLYRLIANSNLPLPPVGIISCHGIHLGAWRTTIGRIGKPQLDAKEKNQLAALLADEKFIKIAEECAKKLPLIADIFKFLVKTDRNF